MSKSLTSREPLSPTPLSLSFPDGTKKSPTKSNLMKIIDHTEVVQDDAYANVGTYVVDLMAAIQAAGSFATVEELINRVLSTFPRDRGKIDPVEHSYREISWKSLGKTPQDQLEGWDHLPSLSHRKLRSETLMPSYMKTKISLS